MSADDKGDHGPRGEMSTEEREALRKRSADLGRRLDEVKHRSETSARGQTTSRGEAMGKALRVSTELIGGILVGSTIGWFLDRWLGFEKPWFFILFFLLGAAAGMLNVIRSAMREKTPPLPSVKDDDEQA